MQAFFFFYWTVRLVFLFGNYDENPIREILEKLFLTDYKQTIYQKRLHNVSAFRVVKIFRESNTLKKNC